MVNVGGRSKGCSTCRQRRVKCDETRPICNRCARHGLECNGPKDTTFIEANIANSRRTDRPQNASSSLEGGTALSEIRQIPQSAPLGHQFDIYICYARKFLRCGGAIELVLDQTQLSDIVKAGTSVGEGQIFHQAILSFAVTIFGIQHKDASVISRGYAIHGVALRRLNQALSEFECYARDEVILSVATLAILECAVPTGPNNYLKHMLGLEKLLELRGHIANTSWISAELYKSVRHMILFASLRTGKPSILARAEWKTLLRAHCLDEEIPEQDLFDVLADCTVLTAKRKNMLASWDLDLGKSQQRRKHIEQRALGLLDQLHTWREEWDHDERNSHVETPIAFARRVLLNPPAQSRTDELGPFLTFFEFANESVAIKLMLYNTTLIQVLQILISLPLSIPDFEFDQNLTQNASRNTTQLVHIGQHTKYQYLAREHAAALEICRCIPYYWGEKKRLDLNASPIVHWSISTTWTTLFRHDSLEGRWMMDLLYATNPEMVAKGLWGDTNGSSSVTEESITPPAS